MESTITDKHGFVWWVPPFTFAVQTSEHEYEFREEVRKTIQKGVFYDIGAHDGCWAIPLSREFDKVYAFEPCPINLNVLSKNCELNKASNVKIVDAAVSNSERMGKLKQSFADNTGSYIMLSDENYFPQMPTVAEYDVAIITIDDFVKRGADPPNLVKIDTEGSEKNVLEGMLETLKTYKPILVIEIHEENSVQRMFKYIDSLGYRYIYADLKPNSGSSLSTICVPV